MGAPDKLGSMLLDSWRILSHTLPKKMYSSVFQIVHTQKFPGIDKEAFFLFWKGVFAGKSSGGILGLPGPFKMLWALSKVEFLDFQKHGKNVDCCGPFEFSGPISTCWQFFFPKKGWRYKCEKNYTPVSRRCTFKRGMPSLVSMHLECVVLQSFVASLGLRIFCFCVATATTPEYWYQSDSVQLQARRSLTMDSSDN